MLSLCGVTALSKVTVSLPHFLSPYLVDILFQVGSLLHRIHYRPLPSLLHAEKVTEVVNIQKLLNPCQPTSLLTYSIHILDIIIPKTSPFNSLSVSGTSCYN